MSKVNEFSEKGGICNVWAELPSALGVVEATAVYDELKDKLSSISGADFNHVAPVQTVEFDDEYGVIESDDTYWLETYLCFVVSNEGEDGENAISIAEAVADAIERARTGDVTGERKGGIGTFYGFLPKAIGNVAINVASKDWKEAAEDAFEMNINSAYVQIQQAIDEVHQPPIATVREEARDEGMFVVEFNDHANLPDSVAVVRAVATSIAKLNGGS